jgi:hypothetical protein
MRITINTNLVLDELETNTNTSVETNTELEDKEELYDVERIIIYKIIRGV